MTRRKICYVVTVESAVTCFLLEQLRVAAKRYDITLVVNTNDPDFLRKRGVENKRGQV